MWATKYKSGPKELLVYRLGDSNAKKATKTIKGKPETTAEEVGIVPKVLVRTGDKVKAGSPLMMDKVYPEIKFVSPVSGEVTAVNRGEKRKVLSIIVRPDAQNKFETFDIKDLTSYNVKKLKALLLETGL